jgi:hypothetical protein
METAYIYNIDTKEIAEELTNVENYTDCDEAYSNYDDEQYGLTFTPAFGTVDGLVWPDKDKGIKFYGNDQETVIETRKGIFLIQSPDMTVEYEELGEIPDGFEEVNQEACLGLDVPKDIL